MPINQFWYPNRYVLWAFHLTYKKLVRTAFSRAGNKKEQMKKNRIIFWISTSIIFLFEGLMPLITLLFMSQYVTAGTEPLGYPDYFAYALIICKVLGATAIMIPKLPKKLREWAYAGLTFNLIFATISHAVVDGNVAYILTPIAVGVVLAVSYFYNLKIKTK